jgi:hypothetical protein
MSEDKVKVTDVEDEEAIARALHNEAEEQPEQNRLDYSIYMDDEF